MAAISFSENITRQNSLDTTASFGTIGGGPGAAILPEFAYQGTAAAARRINAANTDHGRNIDNSPRTLFQHWFCNRFDAIKRAFQICIKDFIPIRLFHTDN